MAQVAVGNMPVYLGTLLVMVLGFISGLFSMGAKQIAVVNPGAVKQAMAQPFNLASSPPAPDLEPVQKTKVLACLADLLADLLAIDPEISGMPGRCADLSVCALRNLTGFILPTSCTLPCPTIESSLRPGFCQMVESHSGNPVGP